jgi:redox-sensitive bicupin YhaK (pirin superfamily)
VNRIDGAEIRVFLGSLAGRTSPIPTFTPLLGAEIVLGPDAHMSLGVDPRFEHGVLVDTGDVVVAGTRVRAAQLGYVGTGVRSLTLSNRGSAPARFLLLGGTPFDEEILMWWNFVGRTHEEIAAARADWESGTRFGAVHGYDGGRIPAPPMPITRLVARGRVR